MKSKNIYQISFLKSIFAVLILSSTLATAEETKTCKFTQTETETSLGEKTFSIQGKNSADMKSDEYTVSENGLIFTNVLAVNAFLSSIRSEAGPVAILTITIDELTHSNDGGDARTISELTLRSDQLKGSTLSEKLYSIRNLTFNVDGFGLVSLSCEDSI